MNTFVFNIFEYWIIYFFCKYYRHIAVYNNILVIYMVAVGFNFQWNLSFCHPCMVFSRQVVYQESFILHSEELLLFKVVLEKRVIMSASPKGDNLFYPKFIFFRFRFFWYNLVQSRTLSLSEDAVPLYFIRTCIY